MNIVVTGGAGFIGSHVVDGYLSLGHQVMVVDDLSTGRAELLDPRVRLVEEDIRSAGAASAVEAFRPEVLNLHAAQIDVRRSVTDPGLDASINILGTINLVEAARRGGALSRVVYAASGGSMYGDTQRVPTPEDAPAMPVSPYGVSKFAAETYLHCFRALYGLEVVALRYANVYGPRQNAHGEAGVVAIFAERLKRGEPCTINGDGEQTRDFVFVEDVARANLAALTVTRSGGFNIATGVATSVNRIYTLLAAAMGVSTPARYGPGKPGEQRVSVLSPALAGEVLGWTPRVDIEQGIAATAAWFRG